MIHPRHRAREVALQILYRFEVDTQSRGDSARGTDELLAELNQHFDHFQVPAPLREFAANLVSGALLEVHQLDGVLEKYAANWKVSRMALVDRCLLRMAVYELIRLPETPPSVVIDEAVELAKQFGTADTPAFINGILDSIHRAMNSGELNTAEIAQS